MKPMDVFCLIGVVTVAYYLYRWLQFGYRQRLAKRRLRALAADTGLEWRATQYRAEFNGLVLTVEQGRHSEGWTYKVHENGNWQTIIDDIRWTAYSDRETAQQMAIGAVREYLKAQVKAAA